MHSKPILCLCVYIQLMSVPLIFFRYLETVPRECINQVLYAAIENTLVGNCFRFVFCLPPTIKMQDNLLCIIELLKGSNLKEKQLIVTAIKMLGNNSATVLHRLECTSSSPPQAISDPGASDHPQQHNTTVNIDDTDFLAGTQGMSSPSQALLLETYVDSQESSLTCSTGTSYPQASFAPQSPITTPLPDSFFNLSTPTQHTNCLECVKINSVYDTPHSQPSFVKKSASHKKVTLSQETIQDYLVELNRTEWLVKELESDWEYTQQNASPFISQHNVAMSLSEGTLKELQEPFSQSRQSTPNVTQHNTDVSSLEGTSLLLGDQPLSETSPDLFSSVYSTRTLIGTDSSHPSLLYTPIQLLQSVRRGNTSPELFESLPRNEWKNVCCQNTPAIAVSKGRTQALRRKLVQDTVNVTPCTLNSSQIIYNNAFSPDIV